MRISALVLLLPLALAMPCASAIDTSPGAIPPFDPDVRHGTLPNGMRWLVRQNAKPEKRVELRLAVKVGSVQETEEERGLAHFAEHMNFNGSENFKPGELVPWLESIGSRFGADSNAYTSYDETVYILQVPTDKPADVDKALLVMADWAGRATLTTEEIDKERGVVLDELRGNKGARKRIGDIQDQVLYKGSRYADRLTIGLESVITGASPDTLRGFYKKWYRPDVMAIIAVGDFDPQAMEARIRDVFGKLPKPAAATLIPEWPVPPHDETLYSVESDKELTSSSVQVLWKHPPAPLKTVGDHRVHAVRQLAGALLALRLAERAQGVDPPFLSAGAWFSDGEKTLATFGLSARSKDGLLPEATTALMEELERARRFGLLPAELERVKTISVASAETRLKEASQRRSQQRIGELVSTFLEDEVPTSEQYDFDLLKAQLPGITVEEVNAALRELTATKSRVVLASVPLHAPGAGPAVPTVDRMKAAVEPPAGFQVAAYVDALAGKKLVDFEPTPGKIVSRRAFPEVGAEEITLSNGARIVVKVTDFRADQVLLGGWAPEGASTFGPKGHATAMRADTLALGSGLGDFTAPQLLRQLQGQGAIAGASPSVSRFGRAFSGSARPQDVETMLQLVHLYFAKPAFREEAFRRMVDSETEAIRNELNSPGGVYGRAVDVALHGGHWLFEPHSLEMVQSLDKAALERAYRDMFDDASEWTFFLVGNVDAGRHLPLVEKWVGSLPTKSASPVALTSPSWDALELTFPAGNVRKEVRKGIEDQSRTMFTFPAQTLLDPQAEFDVAAATDLLGIKLREKLREELGETYGASVGYSSLSPYPRFGRVVVSWTSAPAPRERMMQVVHDTIASLRADGPVQADVDKLKQMRLNSLDEAQVENGYWLSELRRAYLLGREPKSILEQRGRIERLSVPSLHAAINKWLAPGQTLEVYLVPETWQPAAKPQPAETAATPAG